MTSDPNTLMQQAACFRCLPPGMQREAQIYLLAKWANAADQPTGSFSYSPPDATVSWNDKNGAFSGDLQTFNDQADIATVTFISLDSDGELASISNLSALQALIQLDASLNSLTSLDVSGNPALKELNCYANSITSLNLAANTSLVLLECGMNGMTSLLLPSSQINSIDCSQNALSVSMVNTILASLNNSGVLNGSATLNDQTPAAPPSHGPPDGIAAKAALGGKGWTVLTD